MESVTETTMAQRRLPMTRVSLGHFGTSTHVDDEILPTFCDVSRP